MSANEAAIEKEIQDKGLNAPRLTPEHIDSIVACEYVGRASEMFASAPMVPAMECLTICVLVTKNGFTVTGTSACASPENFDAEIGAKIARENARKQLWPLEGYLLRERLQSQSAA